MFLGVILWFALSIFLLNCGFHRVGFSMWCPIVAPVLLLDWCYKKWHKQSTDDL